MGSNHAWSCPCLSSWLSCLLLVYRAVRNPPQLPHSGESGINRNSQGAKEKQNDFELSWKTNSTTERTLVSKVTWFEFMWFSWINPLGPSRGIEFMWQTQNWNLEPYRELHFLLHDQVDSRLTLRLNQSCQFMFASDIEEVEQIWFVRGQFPFLFSFFFVWQLIHLTIKNQFSQKTCFRFCLRSRSLFRSYFADPRPRVTVFDVNLGIFRARNYLWLKNIYWECTFCHVLTRLFFKSLLYYCKSSLKIVHSLKCPGKLAWLASPSPQQSL